MKDIKSLLPNLLAKLQPLWRYRLVVFLLFVAGLCAYLVVNINKAASIPASTEVVTTSKAAPRIDPKVVQQLQELQDNSVSAQSLFNQERENPFE